MFDHDDEDLQINGVPAGSGGFTMNGITWAGHDFLDSVRDEEIWRRTKAGFAHAGGFTMDLVKALAKGLIQKKVEALTGVQMNI